MIAIIYGDSQTMTITAKIADFQHWGYSAMTSKETKTPEKCDQFETKSGEYVKEIQGFARALFKSKSFFYP